MAITVADLTHRDVRSGKRLDIAFLLLDGLRRTKAGKSQDVALCVLGLGSEGTPQPVALRIVAHETERAWSDLLHDLKRRGLGGGLLLVCCDDHPALLKAAQAAFPDTPLQISVAHRLLTLARKVDPQSRAACLAEARQIFSAPDLGSAVARFRVWRANWTKLGHRIVGSLEVDLAACLMFHRFPADLWSKIRTVNLVERMFREARRVPQLELPEALRDWDDSVDAGEVESSLPVESPAPVELPAPAEPPVPTEPLAVIDPPPAVESPADETAVTSPADVAPRVPRVHSVDLSQDPDFMWWLGQYRRTHSRQSRVLVVVIALIGLVTGIILARGI